MAGNSSFSRFLLEISQPPEEPEPVLKTRPFHHLCQLISVVQDKTGAGGAEPPQLPERDKPVREPPGWALTAGQSHPTPLREP